MNFAAWRRGLGSTYHGKGGRERGEGQSCDDEWRGQFRRDRLAAARGMGEDDNYLFWNGSFPDLSSSPDWVFRLWLWQSAKQGHGFLLARELLSLLLVLDLFTYPAFTQSTGRWCSDPFLDWFGTRNYICVWYYRRVPWSSTQGVFEHLSAFETGHFV